jgi:hypothetical protein
LEGLEDIEDLFEYNKEDFESVFESLCKLPGTVEGSKLVPTSQKTVSTKSKKRIKIAAEDTRYYAQIGREITARNMMWKTLQNFNVQCYGICLYLAYSCAWIREESNPLQFSTLERRNRKSGM